MIPTIDVSGLVEGVAGATERVAGEIAATYSTLGFAYVVNHGVAPAVVDAAFEASRAFHALPLDEKMRLEINSAHRGYIPIDTSTTKTSSIATVTRPNQSASLMVMHDVDPDDERVHAGVPLAGPNQWPQGLPALRPALESYTRALTALARSLVTAIEHALGAQAGELLHAFDEPTTFLRLLHYPATGQTSAGYFGSAPHSDYGFLTLLAQDSVGGLQVRTPDGQWLDVPPKPGSFVLNTADILHRWSNGTLLSTPHRVLPTSGSDRYSIPFFFDPDVRTVVEPLSCCVSPERPPRFDAVAYGDYLMHRLRRNHAQHAESGAAETS